MYISVVVGSMNDVRHLDEIEKTQIVVDVSQIIRQTGSHFNRLRRDSPTLQGTIIAPRKCGIIKGDGLFLMTGRVRLGDLTMGCAPYLEEWDEMVSKAELEGRLECSRDWGDRTSGHVIYLSLSLALMGWCTERRD